MKQKLTLAAALALAAGTAMASLPDFKTLDKDGDGMISKQEATKSEQLVAVFARADVDKDGMISPSEYDAIK